MSISDNVSMFFNAKPHIFEKAKMLRKNMTQAEEILWEQLRGKKLLGLRLGLIFDRSYGIPCISTI